MLRRLPAGPLPWLVIVLAGSLALVLLRVHGLGDRFLTLDDAFISFRYAQHFVEGHGLVYNLGERVEGYTNFLWTVLIAGGIKLGLEPVRFTEWANLAVVLATTGWLFVAGRRLFGSVPWALLPPLVYCLGDRARFVVSGMEMLLFPLLVFAGVWLIAGPGADPAPRVRLLTGGLVFALAGMTHPEGLLYGALTGLWLVGRRFRLAGARAALTDGAMVLFGCLVLILPWTVWRIGYYGEVLPNTAYAKLGTSWIERVLTAHESLGDLLRFASYIPWLLLGVLGWLGARRREPFFGLAALVSGTVLLYFYWAGGDYVPFFGARFLLPALPFLLLLGTAGLRWLAALLEPRPRMRRWAVGGLLSLAVADSAWWLWPAHLYALEELDLQHRAWVECADWVAANSAPGTLIASGAAGIIPYRAERPMIDMYGLTDAHISRADPDPTAAPAHQKTDGAYVLDRAPEWILSYGVTPYGAPSTGGLRWLRERVRQEYQIVAQVKVRQGEPPGGRWIVETDGFDAALYRRGWTMAILRRREIPLAPRTRQRNALDSTFFSQPPRPAASSP